MPAKTGFKSASAPYTFRCGGDDGIRTHDPLLAGQVLSQLSYTPTYLNPALYLLRCSPKIEQQKISKLGPSVPRS